MRANQLLLTTQNLIWENSKLFSTKRIVCPLHEVKVVNGNIQAFMSGYKKYRRLEVHFTNGEQKEFNVVDNTKKDKAQKLEIIKWLKALSIAVTGTDGNFDGLDEGLHPAKRAGMTGISEAAGSGREIGKGISSAVLGSGILGDR